MPAHPTSTCHVRVAVLPHRPTTPHPASTYLPRYHLQYWPTAPSTRPPSEEERSTLTTDSALLHLGLGIFHMKTSEREHLKGSQEGSKAACRRALSLPAAAARRHLDTALRLWGDGESNPVPAQAAGEQPEQAHNPNKDKAKVLAWRARAHMALGSPDAASADAAAAAKLSRDPGVRKVFTEVLEAKRQSERLKKHQAAAAHDHHGPPVPRETCWARFKEDLRCRVVDWIDDYLGERLADPDPELVASRKEAAHLAEVASRPEL